MRNAAPNGTFPLTKKRKKHVYRFSFSSRDNIIRNIEIIVACIVAFIVGVGVYGVM